MRLRGGAFLCPELVVFLRGRRISPFLIDRSPLPTRSRFFLSGICRVRLFLVPGRRIDTNFPPRPHNLRVFYYRSLPWLPSGLVHHPQKRKEPLPLPHQRDVAVDPLTPHPSSPPNRRTSISLLRHARSHLRSRPTFPAPFDTF